MSHSPWRSAQCDAFSEKAQLAIRKGATPVTEGRLDELSLDVCLDLLRAGTVGRIGVVVDDFPVVVPINYRLVETEGRPRVMVRTRLGNVIERASLNVAFEIDGIDPLHEQGWSVLVRGTLQHVDLYADDFRESFDPHPWLGDERDTWLIVEPFSITGRHLKPDEPSALERTLCRLPGGGAEAKP